MERKRVTMAFRVDAEVADRIQAEADKQNTSASDILNKLVTGSVITVEPEPVKNAIVMNDMKLQTIAAILEVSDKMQISYPQAVDFVFEQLVIKAGQVEDKYIELAKERITDGH